MTLHYIMLGIGCLILIVNLVYVPISFKQKRHGWAITHAVITVIMFLSLMSGWDEYKKYEAELSELEYQRQVVRMVVTASYIDFPSKQRVIEVWIDKYEVPYVCSMMTAFGSYKDKRSANWLNVECLNAITDEQIPYMTKENLFPKGVEPDWDIGPALTDFLKGQKA